jgi:hypothetical protein
MHHNVDTSSYYPWDVSDDAARCGVTARSCLRCLQQRGDIAQLRAVKETNADPRDSAMYGRIHRQCLLPSTPFRAVAVLKSPLRNIQ